MKEEYDLSKLKKIAHPMQEKIEKGEIKLMSIFDIPDREAKLAALEPDERDFVLDLFARKSASNFNNPVPQTL